MVNKRDQWARLKCDCGSQDFMPKFYLITRQGGGTTQEPAGWVCRQCTADVDTRRLMDLLEVERKKAEVKELQEQIAAQHRDARIEQANSGSA